MIFWLLPIKYLFYLVLHIDILIVILCKIQNVKIMLN